MEIRFSFWLESHNKFLQSILNLCNQVKMLLRNMNFFGREGLIERTKVKR